MRAGEMMTMKVGEKTMKKRGTNLSQGRHRLVPAKLKHTERKVGFNDICSCRCVYKQQQKSDNNNNKKQQANILIPYLQWQNSFGGKLNGRHQGAFYIIKKTLPTSTFSVNQIDLSQSNASLVSISQSNASLVGISQSNASPRSGHSFFLTTDRILRLRR